MQIKVTKAFICSRGAMQPGSVVDLDDVMALDLIATGLAEPVITKKTAEKATKRKAHETAVTR